MSIDPLAMDYVYNSPYAFAENKVGMGRELEGCELGPFVNFALAEPPVSTPIMNTVRASAEIGGKTAEIGGKTEVHHVIPRALKNNETVKAARKDGFKFEGAENKVPVEKFSKATGKGQHGNHPNYTSKIENKIESGKVEGASPVDIIRNIVSEVKEQIKANPEVKINEVLDTVTPVIENTSTPKPELPRRIQQKTESKQKPATEQTFI